jgi:hypothetical protein
VAGRLRSRDAVDVAIARVDGVRRPDELLEIAAAVLEEGDGRLARQRIEAGGIHGQRLGD